MQMDGMTPLYWLGLFVQPRLELEGTETSGSPSTVALARLVHPAPIRTRGETSGSPATVALVRPVHPAPIRTRGETSGSPSTVALARPVHPAPIRTRGETSGSPSTVALARPVHPAPIRTRGETSGSPSTVALARPVHPAPTRTRGETSGSPSTVVLGDLGAISHNPFLADQEVKDEDAARKLHCKLMLLKRSLRDNAASFLLSLTVEECGQYDILRKILTKRYMPAEAQYVRRTQLRTKHRQHGESLATLADDIRLLTARAYPRAGELERDDYAMESCIQALGESLRARVRDSQPKTMHDALRRGSLFGSPFIC